MLYTPQVDALATVVRLLTEARRAPTVSLHPGPSNRTLVKILIRKFRCYLGFYDNYKLMIVSYWLINTLEILLILFAVN